MDRIQGLALTRKLLDKNLASLKNLPFLGVPEEGWIRTIRQSLGMSAQQLGARIAPGAARAKNGNQHLGITETSVRSMERGEVSGGITLSSLARAAEALDCQLVYAFVPHTSLEETFERQVDKVVGTIAAQTDTTMALEDQQSEDFLDREQAKQSLLRHYSLWSR
ncbi:MAG: mobile mystery protein A [Raoultibacter sp.]